MRRFDNNPNWQRDERPRGRSPGFATGILGSGPGALPVPNLQQEMFGNPGEDIINNLVRRQEQMLAEKVIREARYGNDSPMDNRFGGPGGDGPRGLMDNNRGFGRDPPSLFDDRPIIDDRRPIIEDRRPLLDDRRSLLDEHRSILDDHRAILEDRRPIMDHPIGVDNRPILDDRRPILDDRRPILDDRRPIMDRPIGLLDARPIINDRPIIDDRPIIEARPFIDNDRGFGGPRDPPSLMGLDRGFGPGRDFDQRGPGGPLPGPGGPAIPSIFDNSLKRPGSDNGEAFGLSAPKRRSRFDDLRPPPEEDRRFPRAGRDDYDPRFPTEDEFPRPGMDIRRPGEMGRPLLDQPVNNLFYSDGRGKEIFAHLDPRRCTIIPDATLCEIIALIRADLVGVRKEDMICVYVLAGINDFLTRKKCPGYEETIVESLDGDETLTNVIKEMTDLGNDMATGGVRVVFATVPLMSIAIWNRFQNSNGRTSVLLHDQNYEDMQIQLNDALFLLNRAIVSMNSESQGDNRQVYTPLIHSVIRRTKDGFRVLADGCNPKEETAKKMYAILDSAVERNKREMLTGVTETDVLGGVEAKTADVALRYLPYKKPALEDTKLSRDPYKQKPHTVSSGIETSTPNLYYPYKHFEQVEDTIDPVNKGKQDVVSYPYKRHSNFEHAEDTVDTGKPDLISYPYTRPSRFEHSKDTIDPINTGKQDLVSYPYKRQSNFEHTKVTIDVNTGKRGLLTYPYKQQQTFPHTIVSSDAVVTEQNQDSDEEDDVMMSDAGNVYVDENAKMSAGGSRSQTSQQSGYTLGFASNAPFSSMQPKRFTDRPTLQPNPYIDGSPLQPNVSTDRPTFQPNPFINRPTAQPNLLIDRPILQSNPYTATPMFQPKPSLDSQTSNTKSKIGKVNNVFYSDGRTEDALPQSAKCIVIEGASLGELIVRIREDMKFTRPEDNICIYVFGGIHDFLIRRTVNGHEEVTCNCEKGVVDILVNNMTSLAADMEKVGVRVVFATVPTASLYFWNISLCKGVIQDIIHQHNNENKYNHMQDFLNVEIKELNDKIFTVNNTKRNGLDGMFVPKIHHVINHTQGKNSKEIVHRYQYLSDGMKPEPHAIEKMRKLVEKSVQVNDSAWLLKLLENAMGRSEAPSLGGSEIINLSGNESNIDRSNIGFVGASYASGIGATDRGIVEGTSWIGETDSRVDRSTDRINMSDASKSDGNRSKSGTSRKDRRESRDRGRIEKRDSGRIDTSDLSSTRRSDTSRSDRSRSKSGTSGKHGRDRSKSGTRWDNGSDRGRKDRRDSSRIDGKNKDRRDTGRRGSNDKGTDPGKMFHDDKKSKTERQNVTMVNQHSTQVAISYPAPFIPTYGGYIPQMNMIKTVVMSNVVEVVRPLPQPHNLVTIPQPQNLMSLQQPQTLVSLPQPQNFVPLPQPQNLVGILPRGPTLVATLPHPQGVSQTKINPQVSTVNNMYYSDGRSREMLSHLEPSRCIIIENATLCDLIATIRSHSEYIHTENTCVYVFGGIHDFLSKKNEETIYISAEKVTVDRLIKEMTCLKYDMAKIGVKVVFATVPSMSLRDWNQTCLTRGTTTALQFENSYKTMQLFLHGELMRLNGQILNVNRHHGRETYAPLIHQIINRHRGKNKGITYQYKMLEDGLNPSPETATKMRQILERAVKVNDSSTLTGVAATVGSGEVNMSDEGNVYVDDGDALHVEANVSMPETSQQSIPNSSQGAQSKPPAQNTESLVSAAVAYAKRTVKKTGIPVVMSGGDLSQVELCNLFYSDGRGRDMLSLSQEYYNHSTIMEHATLQELIQQIRKDVANSARKIHCVYVFGGINDLLKQERGKRYRETIYQAESTHIPGLVKEMTSLADAMVKLGIRVVFAPVCSIILDTLNRDYYAKRKTDVLHFEKKYEIMQTKLNDAVGSLNVAIMNVNNTKRNGHSVYVPRIHSIIMPPRKKKNKSSYREKLQDGFNYKTTASAKMAEVLRKAVNMNDNAIRNRLTNAELLKHATEQGTVSKPPWAVDVPHKHGDASDDPVVTTKGKAGDTDGQTELAAKPSADKAKVVSSAGADISSTKPKLSTRESKRLQTKLRTNTITHRKIEVNIKFFYSDGRGREMLSEMDSKQCNITEKATVMELISHVRRDFKDVEMEGNSLVTVYVFGGTYDLLETKCVAGYEETICICDKNTVDLLIKNMKELIIDMRTVGVSVIFATVPTISLDKLNVLRLSSGKTSVLHLTAHYGSMQKLFDDEAKLLNEKIIAMHEVKLTDQFWVSTPLIHQPVSAGKGTGRPVEKLCNDSFVDGINPTPSTADEMRKCLQRSMTRNDAYQQRNEAFNGPPQIPPKSSEACTKSLVNPKNVAFVISEVGSRIEIHSDDETDMLEIGDVVDKCQEMNQLKTKVEKVHTVGSNVVGEVEPIETIDLTREESMEVSTDLDDPIVVDSIPSVETLSHMSEIMDPQESKPSAYEVNDTLFVEVKEVLNLVVRTISEFEERDEDTDNFDEQDSVEFNMDLEKDETQEVGEHYEWAELAEVDVTDDDGISEMEEPLEITPESDTDTDTLSYDDDGTADHWTLDCELTTAHDQKAEVGDQVPEDVLPDDDVSHEIEATPDDKTTELVVLPDYEVPPQVKLPSKEVSKEEETGVGEALPENDVMMEDDVIDLTLEDVEPEDDIPPEEDAMSEENLPEDKLTFGNDTTVEDTVTPDEIIPRDDQMSEHGVIREDDTHDMTHDDNDTPKDTITHEEDITQEENITHEDDISPQDDITAEDDITPQDDNTHQDDITPDDIRPQDDITHEDNITPQDDITHEDNITPQDDNTHEDNVTPQDDIVPQDDITHYDITHEEDITPEDNITHEEYITHEDAITHDHTAQDDIPSEDDITYQNDIPPQDHITLEDITPENDATDEGYKKPEIDEDNTTPQDNITPKSYMTEVDEKLEIEETSQAKGDIPEEEDETTELEIENMDESQEEECTEVEQTPLFADQTENEEIYETPRAKSETPEEDEPTQVEIENMDETKSQEDNESTEEEQSPIFADKTESEDGEQIDEMSQAKSETHEEENEGTQVEIENMEDGQEDTECTEVEQSPLCAGQTEGEDGEEIDETLQGKRESPEEEDEPTQVEVENMDESREDIESTEVVQTPLCADQTEDEGREEIDEPSQAKSETPEEEDEGTQVEIENMDDGQEDTKCTEVQQSPLFANQTEAWEEIDETSGAKSQMDEDEHAQVDIENMDERLEDESTEEEQTPLCSDQTEGEGGEEMEGLEETEMPGDARLKAQQHLRNIERTDSFARKDNNRPNDNRGAGAARGGAARGGRQPGQSRFTNNTQNRPNQNAAQNRANIAQNRPNQSRFSAANRPNTSQNNLNKPNANQNKPGFAQNKPNVTQNKPNTAQNRPNAQQNRPNAQQNKQVTPPNRPNQNKPQTTQNRPNQNKPLTPQNRPNQTPPKPGTTQSPRNVPAKTTTPVKTPTASPKLSGTFVAPAKQAPEAIDVPSDIVEETDTIGDYDPKVAVGQNFVVPVSGFFCKLCHKFYNNQATAKVAHCQTQPHYEKVKKYLENKRQRELTSALAMEFDDVTTNGTAAPVSK